MSERKVAIVTGAASGIGKATVERLSINPQYNIYAADVNPSIHTKFDPTDYPRIIPVELDVRSLSQIDSALQRIVDETGRIDLVVNAAGSIAAGRVKHHARENTDLAKVIHFSMWQTNVAAVQHIMDKVAEVMKRNGGGSIVNITSSKDCFPDPYRRGYEYSKRAIEEITLERAKTYAENGIKVVVVKPGNTTTNIDKGVWINHADAAEPSAVQNFNDWWRRMFGNDPRNVAEVICKIAEGEINQNKVFVGFDAKLGGFLMRAIPGWRHIFFAGSSLLYSGVQVISRLKNNVNHANPIPADLKSMNLTGEWYKQAVLKADDHRTRKGQLINIGDKEFLRIFDGDDCNVKAMEELGIGDNDLDDYLKAKFNQLGEATLRLENCVPGPDGDWEYNYEAEPSKKFALDFVYGKITVKYKGQEIYHSYIHLARRAFIGIDTTLGI